MFAFRVIAGGFFFLVLSVLAGCGSSPDSKSDDSKRDESRPREARDEVTSGEVPTGRDSPALTDADAEAAAADSRRQAIIEQSDGLAQSGDFVKAGDLLRDLLIADPNDVELLFRLSMTKAAQSKLAEAVELLDAIPVEHPDAGLPALGQSADFCFQLKRYDDAERRYLKLLKYAPDAVLAHRQLAYLFNRQGRRHEAAVHVRELCKRGDVRQDELHSLVVLTDAMYDDPKQEASGSAKPYWPIGASGLARRLFNQQEYDQAEALLCEDVAGGKSPPSVVAFYGRIAAEAQNDAQFRWWLSRVDDRTKQFSDYWAAVGTVLLSERRFEEAARALAEAIDRDPTDLISTGRLRQSLLAMGQDELAETWRLRWRAIREILRTNNRISASATANPDAIGDIASRLFAIDRKLEAVMWKSIEGTHRGMPREALMRLNEQRQSILDSNAAFPSLRQRLCGMDRSRYRMPQFEVEPIASPIVTETNDIAPQPVTARFENVADRIGLEHSFWVATSPQYSGFAIYQFFGGAIAALDYDLDGAADLYFGQGAADPPSFRGDKSNRLYRNAEQRLIDVTEASATIGTSYSTGISAGDWNQDGFPDLIVSNIGDDVLLLNNGDGTFSQRVLVEGDKTTRVPTSVAIGDVTGDALPDLFQIAYVEDPDLTKRPDRNELGEVVSALVPTDYAPGPDRMIVNDGSGGHRLMPWDRQLRHTATSLGVVVTDLDGIPGNEIFIGNDLRPNQLWKRDPTSGGWSEVASLLGCGFGYTGGATASMGVAAGDFDANGTLDIHITNYQKEAASLFLQANGAFRDRNLQYRLNADSRSVLGFGTQAIDFDNDSRLDLVVTNGHVENEAQSDEPFEQPPQLFRNLGSQFELAEVEDPSGYWSSKHLGRALARLDFDRDGKTDVAVTHLGATSALLLNRTESQNHWLQLQLVGIDSERDAIGAIVRVKFGDRESSAWVMAGDGYFCRNEAVVSFGLGKVDRIDEILIRWPSGESQVIANVQADRRLLVVEDQPETFELDRR